MKRLLSLAAAALGLLAAPLAQAQADEALAIHDPVGRAGMAAATLQPNDNHDMPVILMAGGANFPYAQPGATTPEQRGAKVFHSDVAVMMPPASCAVCSSVPMVAGKLREPLAYAAFAASDKGVIIAGGCNEKGHTNLVQRVELFGGQARSELLPDLPVATAYPAFATLGHLFFVMGGQETADAVTCLNRCFVLDLENPYAGWKEIASLPQGLMLASAGALNGKVYVAGGCSLHPDAKGAAERTYLNTTYCYDLATNSWTQVADLPETLVGAANPMPEADGELLLLGGDPGNFYRASLKGEAPAKHPGQNRTVYAFDGSSWRAAPLALPIGVATAPAAAFADQVYIISGETHPGVRTAAITSPEAAPHATPAALSATVTPTTPSTPPASEPNHTTMNTTETVETAPNAFVEAVKPIINACADLSWSTLAGAGIVAILAILLGIRKGFRSKPLPKVAPTGGPGKWAWIAVAVLWVVVMLNYFDRQLLSVLNTSITAGGENGIAMTQAQFGMVTSAFLIVYAALSPVGGYLADRFSRKFIILMSLVVWSTVTWLTGTAKTYEELLVWRGLMGVSEAFYIPAALALISDYHRGKTRSMATGLHMSGIYAGQMLAGCGALMAGAPFNLGWRLTFETFGFIGVAYALVVILFLHDPEAPKAAEGDEAVDTANLLDEKKAASNDFSIGQVLKSLFTGRAMAMLLTMYALAGFANWFLMGWYPRLLQDMFGISEAEAGPQATLWINIAKYITVLAGAVVADMWYARNRNARAYVPGIGFTLAGPCVIIAMLPALGVPVEISLTATLALVSMQGVAQGSLDATLMPVLRSQIDERFSATGYGLLNLTSVSAGALISWGGGYLKDMNVPLGVPLSMAGVLMVICGLMFFFLPKQPQAGK